MPVSLLGFALQCSQVRGRCELLVLSCHKLLGALTGCVVLVCAVLVLTSLNLGVSAREDLQFGHILVPGLTAGPVNACGYLGAVWALCVDFGVWTQIILGGLLSPACSGGALCPVPAGEWEKGRLERANILSCWVFVLACRKTDGEPSHPVP